MNAGRGSSVAIFRQMHTKFVKGQIQSVRLNTAMRMAEGAFIEYAFLPGAAVASYASTLFAEACP